MLDRSGVANAGFYTVMYAASLVLPLLVLAARKDQLSLGT